MISGIPFFNEKLDLSNLAKPFSAPSKTAPSCDGLFDTSKTNSNDLIEGLKNALQEAIESVKVAAGNVSSQEGTVEGCSENVEASEEKVAEAGEKKTTAIENFGEAQTALGAATVKLSDANTAYGAALTDLNNLAKPSEDATAEDIAAYTQQLAIKMGAVTAAKKAVEEAKKVVEEAQKEVEATSEEKEAASEALKDAEDILEGRKEELDEANGLLGEYNDTLEAEENNEQEIETQLEQAEQAAPVEETEQVEQAPATSEIVDTAEETAEDTTEETKETEDNKEPAKAEEEKKQEVKEKITNNESTDEDMAKVIMEDIFNSEADGISTSDIIGLNAKDAIEEVSESIKVQSFYTTKVSKNTDKATVDENQAASANFFSAFSNIQDKLSGKNIEFASVADETNYKNSTELSKKLCAGEYVMTDEINKQTSTVEGIQTTNSNKSESENISSKIQGESLLEKLEKIITKDKNVKEDDADKILTQREYDKEEANFFSTDDTTSAFMDLVKDAEQYNIFALAA